MLIARVSITQCYFCEKIQVFQHDIDLEADAGYPYNKARSEAGWDEPFNNGDYRDRCKECRATIGPGKGGETSE